jgi:antitoxin ParD1/3/4
MPTLNVNLTEPLAKFVEREVAGGDYQSASELVRDALRLLKHEKATQSAKLIALKREIGRGIADADAGRWATRSLDDISRDIRENFVNSSRRKPRP